MTYWVVVTRHHKPSYPGGSILNTDAYADLGPAWDYAREVVAGEWSAFTYEHTIEVNDPVATFHDWTAEIYDWTGQLKREIAEDEANQDYIRRVKESASWGRL